MKRSQKSELYALVSDLHALGYRDSDISRVLGFTRQRIQQIVADLDLTPQRLHSLADLPVGFRERIDNLRSSN